jgi:tartrate-resistant acid phosphatase type 5
MRFFFFGDMGSGTNEQYQVADALKNEIDNYGKKTFVCGLGDNIYEYGCKSTDDIKFKTHFEEPYSQISNKVPFYMCLGNHDYGNSDTGNKDAIHQVNYSQLSKKWKMPSTYYKFRRKQGTTIIDFFVIDTNQEFHPPEYTQTQLNKMTQLINKSNADWKIVYGHHTWRSVAGHGNAKPMFDKFMTELFTEAPFDVYMCGHDHTKQVIETKINQKDITMIVCGTGGKQYKDIPDNYQNEPGLVFSSHNLGFGICDVSKHRLDFEFQDEHNNLEYRYQVKKNKEKK